MGVDDAAVLRDPTSPQHVTFLELFFDLVFVFALDRVAQGLIDTLDWSDLLETMVLLPAVWWIWMMTVWMTDRLDPERTSTQLTVIGIMLGTLILASAVPNAFGSRGWFFAGMYVSVQLGRTLYLLAVLRRHRLRRRTLRTLFWFVVSAVPWLLGAASSGPLRLALWALAITIDYVAARLDFPTPGAGRSPISEWGLAAAHMSERYQQIVIIALGGTIIVAGSTFGASDFKLDSIAALVVSFAVTGLLWRIYIYRAGELMYEALTRSANPDHLGRSTAYTHLLIAAAAIAVSVADRLVIAQPLARPHPSWTAVIMAGPVLFLLGRARLEYTVFSRVSYSRRIGLAVLVASIPVMIAVPPLAVAGTMVAILVGVAAGDVAGWRRNPSTPTPPRAQAS
jgi:low temperature requirement protein LtrA